MSATEMPHDDGEGTPTDNGEVRAGREVEPLVSICIRSYNYERFLAEAIESCLGQTYDRVEVLVVDDGSTDDSERVLSAYEDRVLVLRQRNSGQFRAALNGLAVTSGDYVMFLDADDRLHRDTVARMLEAFDRHPGAGRVQWRLRVMTENGWPTGDTLPERGWVMSEGDLARRVLRRRTYVWPNTSGNAYRRDAVEQMLRCLGPGQSFVDVDLALALATPLMGPIVNLSGTGGDYRVHSGNFSKHMKRDPLVFLHDRINEVIVGQAMMVRLGQALGRPVDPDPRAALDWTFAAHRLGSLRLDPASHPLPDDRVLRVAARGMYSVATQPDYSLRARLRRIAWFAGTALGPRSVAERLVTRAFLAQPRCRVPIGRGGAAASPHGGDARPVTTQPVTTQAVTTQAVTARPVVTHPVTARRVPAKSV
jgi:hypothetical protein